MVQNQSALVAMEPKDLFVFRQCHNGECRFRFPAAITADLGIPCPQCGLTTEITRAVPSGAVIRHLTEKLVSPGIETFLDNIRSSYNVGSIFRTADGAGVSHLYLGGITPTPEHPKVAKTALGADMTTTWSYHKNGFETILDLKDRGWLVLGLESEPRGRPLFEFDITRRLQPILLVVGNERAGVDPDILDACDRILSLPMVGHKESLNVSVAYGVAVYWLRHRLFQAAV